MHPTATAKPLTNLSMQVLVTARMHPTATAKPLTNLSTQVLVTALAMEGALGQGAIVV